MSRTHPKEFVSTCSRVVFWVGCILGGGFLRKGRTWAIAFRRGLCTPLFLLNSGRFSIEKGKFNPELWLGLNLYGPSSFPSNFPSSKMSLGSQASTLELDNIICCSQHSKASPLVHVATRRVKASELACKSQHNSLRNEFVLCNEFLLCDVVGSSLLSSASPSLVMPVFLVCKPRA